MSNSTTASDKPKQLNWVRQLRSHLPGGQSAAASPPQNVSTTSYTFREDEGSSTQASDLDLLMGVGENVHREFKVGPVKLAQSKDKGFANDVAARVAARRKDLEAVQGHDFQSGEVVTNEIRSSQAKLLQLYADLEREEKYYGDKANVTTGNKGQQRTVKTDAIGERRKALDRLMEEKFGADWTKIAFEATLALADSGSDDFIEQLVADRVEDDASMTALVNGVLKRQLDREMVSNGVRKTGKELEAAQGSLLRANTGATKVINAVFRKNKEAQEYLDKCDVAMSKLLPAIGKNADLTPSSLKFNKFKGEHPEIKNEDKLREAFNNQNVVKDPNNPIKTTFDANKIYLVDDTITDDIRGELDRRVQSYIGPLGQLIDGIMQMPAPKAVAMVAASVASQARASGITDNAQVAKAVGAFVMLRFIAPKLATSKREAPDAAQAGKMMSKIVQNSANGITTMGKEPWLQPLQDVLNTRADAMNAWFLDIARQGGAVIG